AGTGHGARRLRRAPSPHGPRQGPPGVPSPRRGPRASHRARYRARWGDPPRGPRVRVLIAALACRAGGSRLYGKPLHNLDIERRLTVLEYQIEFLRTQPEISGVVIGVAEGPENEPFHAIARKHGLASIRGDEVDVLM